MLDGSFGLSLAKVLSRARFPSSFLGGGLGRGQTGCGQAGSSSLNSTMGASTEHEAASPSIAASQEQSVRQRENTTILGEAEATKNAVVNPNNMGWTLKKLSCGLLTHPFRHAACEMKEDGMHSSSSEA